jgi:hypothetical protein
MNYPVKTIRLWTRKTEVFVSEVLARKRHGLVASCTRGLFCCLAKAFEASVRVREAWRR